MLPRGLNKSSLLFVFSDLRLSVDRGDHVHPQAAQAAGAVAPTNTGVAAAPEKALGAGVAGSSHHPVFSGLSKRSETDSTVKSYLRSRGFNGAEAVMATETSGPGAGTFDSDAIRTIMNFLQREQDFETAYNDLRDWGMARQTFTSKNCTVSSTPCWCTAYWKCVEKVK